MVDKAGDGVTATATAIIFRNLVHVTNIFHRPTKIVLRKYESLPFR